MHTPEPRNVIRLVLLAAGATISSLMLVDTWTTEEKESKPELSLAYYLDQAELVGTGPDGIILYQVWTQRAQQTVGDESIDMDDVRMVYGPSDGLPWELKANKGKIPADARTIELSGNVIATSGHSKENTTTIRTEKLSIDPATRQATTRLKVVIEYNGRELNATGMKADFAANQLNLLSNVNGKFSP
ncbi:MAG: LPS export ABC transporter periplasmic protein LptC [Xanthomonadales bacterium]|nr:LPS export ABC transporter periplasmic protein LptC [Xanthomonadales bacterium]